MTMARTSATRCTAAHGAGLLSAVGKVLAVLIAMATLAERDSVAHVKAEIGIRCPRLDVMGVQFSLGSAAHTHEAISTIDADSPFGQVARMPRAFSFEASTVSPSRSTGADLSMRLAGLRAVHGPSLSIHVAFERNTASSANQNGRPLLPAGLAAPFGGYPIRMDGEWRSAPTAHALEHRFSDGHDHSIAQQLEPRYVDVAVARWEKFTGRKGARADV